MPDNFDTPRPRRRGRLLPWLVWAFVVVALVVLISMVTPVMPFTAPMAISVVGYSLNPLLLVLAALGLAAAIVALRRRRRVLGVTSAVIAGLMVVGVAVPTSALAGAAAERDVSLSLPGMFTSPEGGLEGPTDTVTYAEVDGTSLKMDVWQAEDQASASNSAVIYVYGGAWLGGSRTDWTPFFQHLTSQGISVFAMDYRLSTPDDPTWDKAPADVACAVGWVKQNAAQYDVDPDRLALSGGSAGGNLALLTAYSGDDDATTPSCETGDRSVRAVVDFYGPSDLEQLYETSPAASVRHALEQYTGTTPSDDPDRYATLSPINYVDQDTPATLILHGGHDTSVPLAQSELLSRELDKAGVDNDLVALPATEHAFDAIYGTFANQIAQVEVTDFLEEHLVD